MIAPSEMPRPISAVVGSNTTSNKAKEKSLWFLVFAVLIAIRMPGVLRGRFWAEEGAVFFTRAWDWPWYQALVAPYGGYMSLVGNASAILATHVPLAKACYVSTGIALLVQLCPIAIIFLSKDEWLQTEKSFSDCCIFDRPQFLCAREFGSTPLAANIT